MIDQDQRSDLLKDQDQRSRSLVKLCGLFLNEVRSYGHTVRALIHMFLQVALGDKISDQFDIIHRVANMMCLPSASLTLLVKVI